MTYIVTHENTHAAALDLSSNPKGFDLQGALAHACQLISEGKPNVAIQDGNGHSIWGMTLSPVAKAPKPSLPIFGRFQIRTLMKSIPLVCAALLVASCPSWASDQQDRFLEFQEDHDTLTYDMNTVQMIGPSRFTITHTTIDTPDMMKLELKAFATLQLYCARADGKYPAPADVFVLGPPDLPVENIEVKTNQTKFAGRIYPHKTVSWDYPYKRLAINTQQGVVQYFAPSFIARISLT